MNTTQFLEILVCQIMLLRNHNRYWRKSITLVSKSALTLPLAVPPATPIKNGVLLSKPLVLANSASFTLILCVKINLRDILTPKIPQLTAILLFLLKTRDIDILLFLFATFFGRATAWILAFLLIIINIDNLEYRM